VIFARIEVTPARWQHIKELFEAALERDPGERAASLSRELINVP